MNFKNPDYQQFGLTLERRFGLVVEHAYHSQEHGYHGPACNIPVERETEICSVLTSCGIPHIVVRDPRIRSKVNIIVDNMSRKAG